MAMHANPIDTSLFAIPAFFSTLSHTTPATNSGLEHLRDSRGSLGCVARTQFVGNRRFPRPLS